MTLAGSDGGRSTDADGAGVFCAPVLALGEGVAGVDGDGAADGDADMTVGDEGAG